MNAVLTRVKRYSIWTGISLLLLVMLLLAAVSTFLATETGSRYVVQQAIRQLSSLPELQLSVGTIRGNLLLGLQLDDLDFSSPAAQVQIGSLRAGWDPFSLFGGTLQLAELELQNIDVVVPQGTDNSDPGLTNPLADFGFAPLPIGLELGRLALTDLSIDQVITIDSLVTQVRLAGADLQLTDLAMAADVISLQGQVDLELTNGLPITAQLDWRYPQSLPLGWANAAGRLQLSGRVDNLDVINSTSSPFRLRSEGSVALFSEQGLTLDLAHRAEQVEFAAGNDTWRLSDADLSTRGTLSALSLGLDSGVSSSLLPDFALTAEGQLTGSALSVNQAQAETAGGELVAALVMDWSQGFELSADYELREADPLALLERELPVSLADLVSTGRFSLVDNEQGQTIELQLESATAVLDEYPLTASGNLLVQDGDVTIDNLLLESEANQLTLSGGYSAEQADIRWQLQAPVLEQFIPGVSAVARGRGYLRGNLAAPEIDADIELSDVSTEAGRVELVQLQVSGDPDGYQGAVELLNAVLSGQDLAISSANLDFQGTRDAHDAALAVDSNRGSAELDFNGGFSEPNGMDWAGRITTTRLLGDAGDWRLLSAAEVAFRDSLISVDNSCWSYQQIQACVSLSPSGTGQQQLDATLARFPLSEFNSPGDSEPLFDLVQIPRLPDDVTLDGMVTGSVSAQFGGAREPQVTASLNADNTLLTLRSLAEDVFGAEVSEAEVMEQQYRWRRLSLRANLDQGQWNINSRAQLNAENVQDSAIELNGNLEANLVIDRDGMLSGSSSAEFADLGWVTAFVPELRDVAGELESTLSFGGTLQQPRIVGDLSINRGSFLVDRAGVTYSDFELQLSSDNFGMATLEGSVGSGDGFVAFNGSAQNLNSDNWNVSADLQGEAFPLANLPDLLLQVSPTLNLNADRSQIALQGEVRVPLLDLTIRELPESAVDISRDVVITDYPEDQPELGMTFTTGQMAVMDTAISADVAIILGEEITLRGFGLEAGLAGSLDIQQEADGTNLTYGELEITDGRYSMYGQTLTLQNGKLLFLGNYDNPAIDIRAVRQVDDLTVGVLMSGTLNNIRSELFSTPSLPESDILAVLVTGRQFGDNQQSSADADAMLNAITRLGIKQSQGLTDEIGNRFGLDTVAITNTGDIDSSTLTIGKYLTPKVFVRYGVGLFDSFSKLAVDYMISDRLTLQAESGQYQSIDFTYRVER